MVTHLPETLWVSAKHYLVKQIDRPVGETRESLFDTVIEGYSGDEPVYLHVGLGDVKRAFQTNPYDFLIEKLEANFSSLLVPGFTQSFRDTGRFDVESTEPEVGMFSHLFFQQDMDYRTPDPLHSIMVKGDYRFDGCDFRDTFGADGAYGRLEEDNVLCLNIGTPWLISTQLHYIEQVLDVPYVDTTEIDGTITYADGRTEPITQTNYQRNNYVYFWNRRKLRDDLLEAGLLDHYQLNGLDIMAFRTGDIREYIESAVASDPYYLVR